MQQHCAAVLLIGCPGLFSHMEHSVSTAEASLRAHRRGTLVTSPTDKLTASTVNGTQHCKQSSGRQLDSSTYPLRASTGMQQTSSAAPVAGHGFLDLGPALHRVLDERQDLCGAAVGEHVAQIPLCSAGQLTAGLRC